MCALDDSEMKLDPLAPAIEDLARHGWLSVADVHLSGRPQSTIERVLIGPGGVAVIEALTWTGPVCVLDGMLRTGGELPSRALQAAVAATAAIAARIPAEYRGIAFGVICLTSQDQADATARAGLHVVGRAQLAAFLTALPPRLSPFDVADLGRHLGRALARPVFPTRTAAAAAYAEVSRSSGRPERSAQVPVLAPGRRAHVRRGAPASEVPAVSAADREAAADLDLVVHPAVGSSARATRRLPGSASGRRGLTGRLLLLLAGGILVMAFALNAAALLQAWGTIFGPTGMSSPVPDLITP